MSVRDLATGINRTLDLIGTALPKPARRKVADATAALVHARSVNTSLIGASLPSAPAGWREREQWLARLFKSSTFSVEQVMAPFARQDLAAAAAHDQTIVLCLDQTELGAKHAILMLALRHENRALPLCWHVEPGEANIGAKRQIALLETVKSWLPEGTQPILMGDRFYPSKELLGWLRANGFGWRIRLKGSTELVCADGHVGKVADLAAYREFYDPDARLFATGIPTGIGWLHDHAHPEGWAIAMDAKPSRATTLDYGLRWGIETMFADFKSRGFDLQNSQMRDPARLAKLLLLVALAFKCCQAALPAALKKTVDAGTPRGVPAVA